MTESSRYPLTLVLVCALLTLLPTIPRSNALNSHPYLFIDPTMYVAHEKNELFSVAVDVINIGNLSSYQFTFFYNNSLLEIEQVSAGSLFPPTPLSWFKFENKTPDSVEITCSLNDSANSRSGTGTLAVIALKVVHAPNSCIGSPLELGQTLLLDSAHVPIVHDIVGGVYFWKSAGPDPPIEGRLLDVYTQRGGIGQGQAGGKYRLGEEVQLFSIVTYNGQPVQGKLVAYEIKNPSNQSILRGATTDQNGLTMISFKIPNVPESVGTWTAIAVVEIAEETAWDIVTFEVTVTLVGGFSTIVTGSGRETPLIPYHMAIFALILVFAMTKHRAKKTRCQHRLTSLVSEEINSYYPRKIFQKA